MQTMFKDKGNQNVEKKHVANVKVTIASMNMVDVHVTTTRIKNFKAQEFKDKEPLKKNATYKEIDKKMKNSMVETIRQLQVTKPIMEVPPIQN